MFRVSANPVVDTVTKLVTVVIALVFVIIGDVNKVAGIISNGEKATAPMIICDPSYVKGLNKTKVVGKVIRAICILDHMIPNTNNSSSVQIILPQRQLNRKSGDARPRPCHRRRIRI